MKINLKNWMSELDGNKLLLKYNILGTHDCVTEFIQFPHISKCQDRNIYEQLCLGVRALDIRVESSDERLKMVHGIAKAFNTRNRLGKQMDLQDVLDHAYRFLKENTSETIIFQFKNDSNKENIKCFNNLYYTYIRDNKKKWFLENRIPTLDEARGKIVLIRRCKMDDCEDFTDKNTGIDFSKWVEQQTAEPEPLTLKTSGENAETFIVQDRFKYKPVPRWNDCIKPFLDKAKEFDEKYIINYISTAGGLKGPKNNAKYINPKFLEYPLSKEKYYGTIYCDFPSEELAKKVIETNL